jgi:hypothetical protein
MQVRDEAMLILPNLLPTMLRRLPHVLGLAAVTEGILG